MSIEALELAADALMIVEPGVSGKATIPFAIMTGATTGLMCSDTKHAALFSALSGAVIPIVQGKASVEKIAMSAIVSTAVGMVANYAKTAYAQREAHRKHVPVTKEEGPAL